MHFDSLSSLVKYKYTLPSVYLFSCAKGLSAVMHQYPLWCSKQAAAWLSAPFNLGAALTKRPMGLIIQFLSPLICSLNTIHCLCPDFERSLPQGCICCSSQNIFSWRCKVLGASDGGAGISKESRKGGFIKFALLFVRS